VTVNGAAKTLSQLPYTAWYDSGATITYSYASPVSASAGKQYAWLSTSSDLGQTAQSGTLTASASGTVTATYITEYELTIAPAMDNPENGATNPPVGTYWYGAGASVSVTAEPAIGFVLDYWKLDSKNVGDQNPYSVTMNGSYTLTPHFKRAKVTITFETSGIESDAAGTVLTIDGATYTYSQLPVQFDWDVASIHTVSTTETPPASVGKRYVWTGWTDGDGLSGSSGSYTVPLSAQTVTANYRIEYQITFTSSGIGSDSSGTVVTINGVAKTQGQLPYTIWYDSASTISFSFASPVPVSSGKRYAWSSTSGLGQTGQSGSFTPSGTGTVTGTYKIQYQLTMATDPSGVGTTSPIVGVSWHDAGDSVPVSASGSGSYMFTSWAGTGIGSYSGSNNPASVTMNAPITETAHFEESSVMTVSYEILDGGSPAPPTFKYKHNGTSENYTLTATPTPIEADPGSAWSITPNPLSGSTSTERWYSNQTLSGTASTTTLVFKFQHQYTLTIQVNDENSGTTDPSPSHYWLKPQQNERVTAMPSSSSCYLEHWKLDDNDVGSAEQYTVTVDAPHILEAFFSSAEGTEILISATGIGPDAISPVVTVDDIFYVYSQFPLTLTWRAGSNHTIETAQSVATSVSGKCYNWVEWSDRGPTRTLQITVDNPMTLTASFKTQYLLSTYSIPPGAQVIRNPPSVDGFYDAGTTVQLAAAGENDGLPFTMWLLNGAAQPKGQTTLTVTMTQPFVALAMYEKTKGQTFAIPAYDAIITPLVALLIFVATIAKRRVKPPRKTTVCHNTDASDGEAGIGNVMNTGCCAPSRTGKHQSDA
jgi:hypothetical protein